MPCVAGSSERANAKHHRRPGKSPVGRISNFVKKHFTMAMPHFLPAAEKCKLDRTHFLQFETH